MPDDTTEAPAPTVPPAAAAPASPDPAAPAESASGAPGPSKTPPSTAKAFPSEPLGAPQGVGTPAPDIEVVEDNPDAELTADEARELLIEDTSPELPGAVEARAALGGDTLGGA